MTKLFKAVLSLFTPPAPPTLAQRLIAVHLHTATFRRTLG